MKEPVHPRDTTVDAQFEFDAAQFSPMNLEDSIVCLINEMFENNILAVSSIDFNPESDTAEPLIVVSSGGLSLSPRERGLVQAEFGLDSYPGSVTNNLSFEQVMTGALTLKCVARSARATTLYSYDLLKFFMEMEYFLPRLMDVNYFAPSTLAPPKKIEDTEHLWESTITCNYKLSRAWSSERLAPRLKTFGLKDLVPN